MEGNELGLEEGCYIAIGLVEEREWGILLFLFGFLFDFNIVDIEKSRIRFRKSLCYLDRSILNIYVYIYKYIL